MALECQCLLLLLTTVHICGNRKFLLVEEVNWDANVQTNWRILHKFAHVSGILRIARNRLPHSSIQTFIFQL